MIPWQQVFNNSGPAGDGSVYVSNLQSLRRFLDWAHVRECLVRPFQEKPDYPLVEARELLPSFDSDTFEYPDLPGFSLVAFGRQLDYFSEIFQFDKLHSVQLTAEGNACPVENQVIRQNMETMAERLPRRLQAPLRDACSGMDATLLDNYAQLLPFLLEMDRAQVMALDNDNLFHLAGIFASFPSDIDAELKRFGIRIGKFQHGDSGMYERNRMFVYQYLMELYGFPIVSERRTSSALFARKLHRMGENFLLRVLGQSDRVITTFMSEGDDRYFPKLDKMALVALDADQDEAARVIKSKGYFLDEERRVVIMKITYRQHKFNRGNVRQDRALSVMHQEILHPLTGKPLAGLNIIKDATNMFLRLNDIVAGEYTGRVIYKRMEVVENTESDEKRLKFLYCWLVKHQRHMVTYPDDYFASVHKVIFGYLQDPKRVEIFDGLHELYQEVCGKLSYIQQARRVRILEDLSQRQFKGSHVTYREMTRQAVSLLNELQYEIVNFFPELVDSIIKCGEAILHDRYLIRNYMERPEARVSRSAHEVRKNYGRLVALVDSIKAVRKARMTCATHCAPEQPELV